MAVPLCRCRPVCSVTVLAPDRHARGLVVILVKHSQLIVFSTGIRLLTTHAFTGEYTANSRARTIASAGTPPNRQPRHRIMPAPRRGKTTTHPRFLEHRLPVSHESHLRVRGRRGSIITINRRVHRDLARIRDTAHTPPQGPDTGGPRVEPEGGERPSNTLTLQRHPKAASQRDHSTYTTPTSRTASQCTYRLHASCIYTRAMRYKCGFHKKEYIYIYILLEKFQKLNKSQMRCRRGQGVHTFKAFELASGLVGPPASSPTF